MKINESHYQPPEAFASPKICKCRSTKEKLQGRTVGTLRNFSLAWDGMGLSAKAIGHLEVVPGSMLPSAGEGTWSQAVERDMKLGRRCEMDIYI